MKFQHPVGVALLGAIGLAVPALAAGAPSISITSPASGSAAITSSQIPVTVSTKGFNLECKDVGQPAKPGQGHFHVMLDGMSMAQMTNLYCTDNFSVSGAALKPGQHTLAVVLASDDHVNVGKPAMAKFDYEPTSPQPLPEAKNAGTPVVKVLSPRPGAVVGRTLDLKVAVSNFDLSCDLEGKPNVAGYGHLHVFVTQANTGMAMSQDMGTMHNDMGAKADKGGMSGMQSMAMPGMIGMPCTTTIPVDLSEWKAGKTKLMVMLANNDHMPTAGAVPAAVDVIVK